MTRDEIIEAMARAIYARFAGGSSGAAIDEIAIAFAMDHANCSITSLCESIPGLAAVLDGKAVIVPVEATLS